MVVFLKSMGNKAWKTVIKGWKHPMVTSEGGTYNLKIDVEWTNDEDDEALGNSNTLNDNFNCMEKNMLRLINTCSEAKEA